MGGLRAAHAAAQRPLRRKSHWRVDARLLDGRVKPGHGENGLSVPSLQFDFAVAEVAIKLGCQTRVMRA